MIEKWLEYEAEYKWLLASVRKGIQLTVKEAKRERERKRGREKYKKLRKDISRFRRHGYMSIGDRWEIETKEEGERTREKEKRRRKRKTSKKQAVRGIQIGVAND